MKQKNFVVLDERDDKIVHLFTKLGMPKNLAKTIMYVSQVEECCSGDIEQGTTLRQPEVSTAMQELQRRGWVKKRELNRKGKGRPVHLYKSAMHLSEILKEVQQEKLKQVELEEKKILALENNINRAGIK